MKFSLYIKRLVSQKDLLSLDEEVSPLLQKHLRAEVDDTNRAIEQMKSGLSEAELEQMLVAQAQQLEVVKHFLNLAANDSRPVPDDWTMLHDGLHVIYDHAVTFLDGKRKDLLEEDYRMCLLILAGFLPKQMVRLLCCTPQKISMQRKRHLASFFNEQGKPADFDRRLRCL